MGISCYYHDSAVALVDEHGIKFAIHEERLSRVKHDARFPFLAVGRALQAVGIGSVVDIDKVVFYEDPARKLRRLWDQAIDFWPKSRQLFFEDIPRFLRHKQFESEVRSKGYPGAIEFSEHHRSHAASAFFTSPFERAIVLTLDGVGEYETVAVHLGEANRLTKVRSIHFPHSLGLFYSVFTQYLGFEVNEGEYKVMGLASYGRPRFLEKLIGPVLRLADDGAFSLNLRMFDFCAHERHYDAELIRHLGIAPRRPDEPVTEAHCDLAASVQQALELAIANMLPPLIREFGTTDFCFAGGVALNCTANARMIRDFGIRSHIHPAAGDAGGALGAALQAVMRTRADAPCHRYEFSPYLGVSYPEALTAKTLSLNGIGHRRSDDVAGDVALRLADGQVVAIWQGRDEWGPRALGGRSILADPRRAEMKEHLNARIKFREEFRPFAPVVTREAYGDWFETLGMEESPHMLYTHRALRPDRTPATTHVDGTSRVQTVSAAQNPYLHRILEAFERRTGVPVLINTSFNLRGEPIVSNPSDALKTFFASGIDCLALEDILVDKNEAGAAASVPVRKTVHLAPQGDAAKALYFDWEKLTLRPNHLFMDAAGSIVYGINESGLKGDERDPSRKLAVVWGDSVAFGVGRSWPCLLDDLAPGYQFLNGGIEGDGYDNILRRATDFNREHEVTLNLLMLGWHPHWMFRFDQSSRRQTRPFLKALGRGRARTEERKIRAGLTAFLRAHPNTVVLTMPTAINASIVDRDLSEFFVEGDDVSGFTFLGRLPYSVATQRALLAFIENRNAIVREVCAEAGVRVVDLFEHFSTERRADFREWFHDILHFRAGAYPLLAQVVHAGIRDLCA